MQLFANGQRRNLEGRAWTEWAAWLNRGDWLTAGDLIGEFEGGRERDLADKLAATEIVAALNWLRRAGALTVADRPAGC